MGFLQRNSGCGRRCRRWLQDRGDTDARTDHEGEHLVERRARTFDEQFALTGITAAAIGCADQRSVPWLAALDHDVDSHPWAAPTNGRPAGPFFHQAGQAIRADAGRMLRCVQRDAETDAIRSLRDPGENQQSTEPA
jgi:hypothetical protein